jgi:hypothetical protein
MLSGKRAILIFKNLVIYHAIIQPYKHSTLHVCKISDIHLLLIKVGI